ncbi:MAG TPA: hypothetical protein VMW06_10855 [Desulfobacterales bacterium]|nr:hypothetical protein [Desulfobacterales bacterium]
MKLIDMKIPKKTKKQLKADMSPSIEAGDREQYPWGLRLSFNKKEIDKLPDLKKAIAGAKIKIAAVGKIIEIRTTDAEKGRERHNVEIQIQKIGFEDQSKTKEQIFEEAIK